MLSMESDPIDKDLLLMYPLPVMLDVDWDSTLFA